MFLAQVGDGYEVLAFEILDERMLGVVALWWSLQLFTGEAAGTREIPVARLPASIDSGCVTIASLIFAKASLSGCHRPASDENFVG